MRNHLAVIAIVLMGVFYSVGFAFLGYALWNAAQSTRAGRWPSVVGSLTEVSFKVNPATGDDSPTYSVEVRYRYGVDGVPYVGSRLAFGYLASSGYRTHSEIYQKLKEADSVSVHYDPRDPSVCCLSFGLHQSIRVLLAFSMIWIGFCLSFTLLFWIARGSDDLILRNLQVH